jgi:hypothetical protein
VKLHKSLLSSRNLSDLDDRSDAKGLADAGKRHVLHSEAGTKAAAPFIACSEDGAITTSPFSRVTGKLAYSWPEGWTAFTQATWYPGDRYSEIAVNFGDPVTATPADIFVSAQPTLVVMAGLTYRFQTAAISPAPAPTLFTK